MLLRERNINIHNNAMSSQAYIENMRVVDVGD